MARKRSACYLSIALITFMSGSRTFLNFGAKMPPDRRPVRQARSAALHNGLRARGWETATTFGSSGAGRAETRLSDYAAEVVKLSPDFSSRPEARRSRRVRVDSFRDRQRSG